MSGRAPVGVLIVTPEFTEWLLNYTYRTTISWWILPVAENGWYWHTDIEGKATKVDRLKSHGYKS